ncbi:MAG TPA: acyl carrier protein [Anaerolineae bacterium]|nr:acyl carrier protein [Anaerolineae bacterium]
MHLYVPWLKNYFEEYTGEPLPVNIETDNYFDAGLIDSFAVIELIEAIEQEFDIEFDEDDFQDRRFVTMAGLSEIIQERKDKKNE